MLLDYFLKKSVLPMSFAVRQSFVFCMQYTVSEFPVAPIFVRMLFHINKLT